MMHPDTEQRFISRQAGFGVFALRRIPRGTVTWVQSEDDRPTEDQRLNPISFTDPED